MNAAVIEIWPTPHACDRYVERVRPSLGDDMAAAVKDIKRVARLGKLQDTPPDWISERPAGEEEPTWLLIGANIALPLSPPNQEGQFIVRTVIVRQKSAAALRRKQLEKQQQKEVKRALNRLEGQEAVQREDA